MSKNLGQMVNLDYDEILEEDRRYDALLFRFGDREVWLPRSLIDVDVDAYTVSVPVWKVELEGLENEVAG